MALNLTGLPQGNLQPGQSGDEVKALQTWLIQNGFNIPAGATGFYGNETKTAVTELQQQLGVDPQGNPGFYGPITRTAVQKTSQPTSQETPAAGSTDAVIAQIAPQLANALGTSVDNATKIAQAMSPNQLGTIGSVFTAANNSYKNSQNITLDSALEAAAKNPSITQPFADSLKIDLANLQQTASTLQTKTNTDMKNLSLQFEKERKDLAEQYASTGQAYSGYRQKAQGDLATTEGGIVTSSISDLQSQLDQATKAFEAKWGTDAASTAFGGSMLSSPGTTPIGLSFTDPLGGGGTDVTGRTLSGTDTTTTLTGAKTGEVTGSAIPGAESSITSLAQDYYSMGQLPGTV